MNIEYELVCKIIRAQLKESGNEEHKLCVLKQYISQLCDHYNFFVVEDNIIQVVSPRDIFIEKVVSSLFTYKLNEFNEYVFLTEVLKDNGTIDEILDSVEIEMRRESITHIINTI